MKPLGTLKTLGRHNAVAMEPYAKGDYDQALTLKRMFLRMMAQRFNLRWYLFAVTAASLA